MSDESEKKGFGGLSSLASEIQEEALPKKASSPPAKPTSEKASAASNGNAGTQTNASEPKSPSTPRTVARTPPSPPKGSSASKWFWSVLGIVILVVLFNAGQDDSRNSGSRSTYSPSSTPSTYTPPRSASNSEFSKPPVGTDNVLSVAQIRWCLREGIRIETMRDIIDTNEGIDEFNRIVNDYNSRCGSYRYRQGSQQRAEREVEAQRSRIVSESIRDARQLGRSSQSLYPSVSPSLSTSSAPTKPSAQYTREGQELLTELGYGPGPVDGDYGRRTADAVKAFQRDAGITQDGWIDQELLSALRTVREKLLKTKAESSGSPAKRQSLAPAVTPSEQTVVAPRGTITAFERVQIENYCERVTSTPGDKNNCIERELRTLRQSGGKPDLSGIPQVERQQIEDYCSRVTSTPGDEYNCILRELRTLRQSGGKPDLSSISRSERTQIENYCSRVTSTPGDEYKCIEREFRTLKQSGGRPDLSSISLSERSQIESYCSRVTSTPGDEYSCISRELRSLKQSGGRPDLSGISQSERAKLEGYCGRVSSTPGDEYNCLRRELNQLHTSRY